MIAAAIAAAASAVRARGQHRVEDKGDRVSAECMADRIGKAQGTNGNNERGCLEPAARRKAWRVSCRQFGPRHGVEALAIAVWDDR